MAQASYQAVQHDFRTHASENKRKTKDTECMVNYHADVGLSATFEAGQVVAFVFHVDLGTKRPLGVRELEARPLALRSRKHVARKAMVRLRSGHGLTTTSRTGPILLGAIASGWLELKVRELFCDLN